MSAVNIRRAVGNIRSGTTVYTPIIESVVNAIQAVEERGTAHGTIDIFVSRSPQAELGDALSPIDGFRVVDNGIGFTNDNRASFDTLYSDRKLSLGGKGFGRFIFLKYFDDVRVDSHFTEGAAIRRRRFRMGQAHDIIVHERIDPSESETPETAVILSKIRTRFPDKQLQTIARVLVERLLPYFIDDDRPCPRITICEADGSGRVVLNDFVRNQLSAAIEEIQLPDGAFRLGGESAPELFSVRLFKFYYPRNTRSKVSLVANRREVTDTTLHTYVPEFIDEFFDRTPYGEEVRERNFVVKAYVFGPYLDAHVSLERGGFDFQRDDDLLYGISQSDIEKAAAAIVQTALGQDVLARQEKKRGRVQAYVDEQAPWHKGLLSQIDLSSLPYNATAEQIETTLQREKFEREAVLRGEIRALLDDVSPSNLTESVSGLVHRINDTSKNDLIHYIALRRNILELFSRSLALRDDGKHETEGAVHDIIFPRKGDSDSTPFDDHNLWIVDERLNFTYYLSSDLPLSQDSKDRPDLLAYNRRVSFRGDNEPSNPIIIFEFKRPQRDDFVNPSSSEDPIAQIVRYVNKIKDGKFTTPHGRTVRVGENTPFYGYVVCDFTAKVEKWLDTEKDFRPMPDRMGWFRWYGNINLYIEVISWDKILRDAQMRNKIFFETLGI